MTEGTDHEPPSATVPERDRVRVGGLTLAHFRTGNGPPIVLVHGFGATSLRWARLASALAPEYEVVAYDARGHGESDAPDSGYALDDRVADLRGLVEALGLDDPVLVGHSMGAATVAWTAARYPELPRAVVLEDPVGLHEQSDRDPDERAAEARAGTEQAEDPSADPQVAAAIARAGYPAPHAETFSQIECPALVVRSDRDVAERVADLDAAESLAEGRLVHVHDAGHHVFDDEYDAALAELRTFLARL